MKTNKYNNYYISGDTKGTLTVIFFFFIVIVLVILSLFPDAESKSFSLIDSLNTSQPVYFDYGSAELNPVNHEILNKLAGELNQNPYTKLYITGHTDDRGSESFNFVLSEKRALAVKDYLVLLGCSPDNIFTLGKGKSEPVNENQTDYERALNRRVVFSLFYKENQETEQTEKDITYLNSSLKQIARNEVKCELSVRDSSGEPVAGIQEQDVSAVLKWENKTEDSALGSIHFIPIDDKKKIAFTLTMDYSPSMYNDRFENNAPKTEKILAMENAVQSFIRLMDDNTTAKIIKFGRVIDLIQSFTKSKDALYKAITSYCYPREGTALYKSIYSALCDASFENNPTIMKTIIAFTDGEENSSGKITKDSIYKLSELKGIKVYTVGLLDPHKHSFPLGLNGQGEADLVDIAGRTGGFYWWASNSAQLPGIYTSIFNQIMKSYSVSIIWNDLKLPPKGTKVTAVLRVNVFGKIRTVYKNYIME